MVIDSLFDHDDVIAITIVNLPAVLHTILNFIILYLTGSFHFNVYQNLEPDNIKELDRISHGAGLGSAKFLVIVDSLHQLYEELCFVIRAVSCE